MIQELLGSTATDMLERTVSFTERRHDVILQNIANVSTPGYVQQDVSVKDFEQSLQSALDRQRETYNTPFEPESSDTVSFNANSSNVTLSPKPVVKGAVFHDRGVRSMESIMADMADNAQAHNMAIQMLQNRYGWVKQAIQLRV